MSYRRNNRQGQQRSDKRVNSRYFGADGEPLVDSVYVERLIESSDGDCLQTIHQSRRALACGCLPDKQTMIAGVCGECIRINRRRSNRSNPLVCARHLVQCRCGASLCWSHSKPSAKDPAVRYCSRCHRKERWKVFWESLLGFLVGVWHGRKQG